MVLLIAADVGGFVPEVWMSLLCKVFNSCLRLNTLPKYLPYLVFKKGNLKYPNWELCMSLKLCSKNKPLFFKRWQYRKTADRNKTLRFIWWWAVYERKTGVGSIYILLYNKEMGLAQSLVLWEPEEQEVSMLAVSLKALKLLFKFKLSHKWKEVQQVQPDFHRRLSELT